MVPLPDPEGYDWDAIGEIALGALEGLGELVSENAVALAVTGLTLGLGTVPYMVFQGWNRYDDLDRANPPEGAAGHQDRWELAAQAANESVNPFYQVAVAGIEADNAYDAGDYRNAGKHGAQAVAGAGQIVATAAGVSKGGGVGRKGMAPRATGSRATGSRFGTVVPGEVAAMVEKGLVEEVTPTRGPVRRTKKKGGAHGNTDDARRQFERMDRDKLNEALGTVKGEDIHHAIELQVLDRYPGAFTAAELNSLENFRGIKAELKAREIGMADDAMKPPAIDRTDPRRPKQLHNSGIRNAWDRVYDQLDADLAKKGLREGTPEWRQYARDYLLAAREAQDRAFGAFYTNPGVASPPQTPPPARQRTYTLQEIAEYTESLDITWFLDERGLTDRVKLSPAAVNQVQAPPPTAAATTR